MNSLSGPFPGELNEAATAVRRALLLTVRQDDPAVRARLDGYRQLLTPDEVTREARFHFDADKERFRALVSEKKTQDEIAQALIKEFNWGSGPAAGNLAGMMQELR